MKKNALFVFGTRPEAIKLAPVILHMKRHSTKFEPVVCVTGQHRQMLDQVLDVFRIEPKFDLSIMRDNQTLSQVTAAILDKLPSVFQEVKPVWTIVQGDTNTAFTTALSSYYHKISLAHVEAGLRTWDTWEPFPEEGVRRMITPIADVHFAPTEWSKANLLRENVPESRIFVTGNTVVDALFFTLKNRESSHPIFPRLGNARMILVTAHRRESFGEPFREICRALAWIAEKNPEVRIIYPVHLNPNVRKPVQETLVNHPNIFLIEPLDYVTFVHLMNRAHLLLTDSGGIQEEGPSFGKPVLVMREKTERPEGVEAGVVKLVGTTFAKITEQVQLLLDSEAALLSMRKDVNPYGDGTSSDKILRTLETIGG